jgi:hypothetical protein
MDSISSRVDKSAQLFTRLSDLTHSLDLQGSKIPVESNVFTQWCEIIGAHRKGRLSLDYRLRDASDLRDTVVYMLDRLIDLLSQGKQPMAFLYTSPRWSIFPLCMTQKLTRIMFVGIETIQPDADVCDDSSSESSFDEALSSPDPKIRLGHFADSITKTVNALIRLPLKDPAPIDKYRGVGSIDMSINRDLDLQYVSETFPLMEDSLKKRVVEGILQRRRLLKYSEEQHSKLRDFLMEDANTMVTPLPKALQKGGLDFQEQTDESSLTPLGSTSTSDSDPRIPPPPAGVELGGDPFECPYCNQIISPQNIHAWR